MFVASNDLFYAPNGDGIELFNGNTPVTGDITSQILLWDAGQKLMKCLDQDQINP